MPGSMTIAGIGGRRAPQQPGEALQFFGDAGVGGGLTRLRRTPAGAANWPAAKCSPLATPRQGRWRPRKLWLRQGSGSGSQAHRPGCQRAPGNRWRRSSPRRARIFRWCSMSGMIWRWLTSLPASSMSSGLTIQLDSRIAWAKPLRRAGGDNTKPTRRPPQGYLGETAEADDPPGARVDQGRERTFGQQAVDVILDDQQIVATGDGDDGVASRQAHGGRGGVLQGGGEVEQLGPAGTARGIQRLWQQSSSSIASPTT